MITRAHVALMLLVLAAEQAVAHEGKMHVARTLGGTLKVHDFDFMDVGVMELATAPLAGWSTHDPEFDSLESDDPLADAYVLNAGAKIFLQVVTFTPALKLWDHELTSSVSGAGETWSLGEQPFMRELVWHIDSADPGFNPGMTEWTATFRLIDTGTTAYSPSTEYTLRFTNVPAPGAAILMLGLAGAARRRR